MTIAAQWDQVLEKGGELADMVSRCRPFNSGRRCTIAMLNAHIRYRIKQGRIFDRFIERRIYIQMRPA